MAAVFPNDDAAPFTGALRAIDPNTGKMKWEWKHPSPTWRGAFYRGGLVFTGDGGNFIALEAASAKRSGISVRRVGVSSPMSFAIDGKQQCSGRCGVGALYLRFALSVAQRFSSGVL